ncbi:MAG: 6-carboxytetrahydropterin synthase QueD [Bryobacteraceae bacterium]|nr:6-carboxytetrahydropterin synthase QueD [Bryobacteraceae bacterium]HEU0142040.1 6-carboxytetrahydropterin synthase QueD [Bryobacteraceae bacterium]
MFEVSVEETFAAAHQLRNYHGKCENLHGHNYRVRVTIRGRELDETGLVVDFVELKRVMRAVIDKLDHTYLNEVPPFDILNPSAENVAKYFHDEVSSGLRAGDRKTAVEVAEIKIWETDTSTATYRP